MEAKYSHFTVYSTTLAIFIVLLLMSMPTWSQSTKVRVIDAETNEPFPFAHLKAFGENGKDEIKAIADANGEYIFQTSVKLTVTVSYVGYSDASETVEPGGSITISLKPSQVDIGEVVVTGQYRPQSVDKSVYKIDLIGKDQITDKGAVNMADLLGTESNIQITYDAAIGTGLKIQGLTGENVKILIDGVPVIGRLNGNIDLSQLNLNNIDHIEMVEGPMSVIYGSNALAGTVNIITKENTRKSLMAGLDLYYENIGQYNAFGTVSFSNKKHTLTLAGGRNLFDGHSFDTARLSQFKPKEQYNLDATYDFKIKNFALKYKVSAFDEYIIHRGNVEINTRFYPYFARAIDTYFKTRRFNNVLKLNQNIGQKSNWELMGAYSIYNRSSQTMVRDMTSLTDTRIEADTTIFTSWVVRGFFASGLADGKLNYQIGADINIDDADGERISAANPRMSDYAGFASATYMVARNTDVQAGLRYIYNTKYDAPLVPSLNLRWKAFDLFNLRASYSRGFRAPSIKELYLDFKDINHNIEGNDSLLAETNNSYNLSLSYNNDSTFLNYGMDMNLFYNDGHNIIDLVPVSNDNSDELLYVNKNFLRRKTLGFTAGAELRIVPAFSLKADVSRTGIARTIPVEDIQVFTDFSYSTDFSIKANYKFVKWNSGISVFYKRNGKTVSPFATGHVSGSNGIGLYVTEPYNTLDISVTYRTSSSGLAVVLGGKNLFNTTYVDITNGEQSLDRLTSWGRTFFIKLTYDFSKF